ncbi:MAG: hypothetical protein MR750_02260 [Methanobrevibacter boviskoreani]|jgi:putative Mn2+ efflux pump MntP|uniref:hypothetical protein n=1 Tax=Methanobrevibacter boviskoreani TaxID=1348249 RepID=UPI0023A908EF|nr:hypothetical protein [Methanobrevibacter boviskoreani]MCI6930069.1 hypothetical protein [Methanobrevibacter boviskoreani]
MSFMSEIKPFLPLIIFGNIENLVLASQGVTAGVDPIVLGGLSLILVIIWLLIGTFGTKIAIKYADAIEFIGGLAIFILGIQSMLEAVHII